ADSVANRFIRALKPRWNSAVEIPISRYAAARAWMLLSRICMPTNTREVITPAAAKVCRTVLLDRGDSQRLPIKSLPVFVYSLLPNEIKLSSGGRKWQLDSAY